MISTLITEYSQVPQQVMEPAPMPVDLPQAKCSSSVAASVVLALLFVCLSIGAFMFAPDESSARKKPQVQTRVHYVTTTMARIN
jgi:hypothetical protein